MHIHQTAGEESIFDRISFWILIVTAFLLPLIFIPVAGYPFAQVKVLLSVVASLVSFSLAIAGALKRGSFLMPESPVLYALGAVVVVTVLSALFSSVPSLSFIGDGSEVGTAGFLIAGFAALITSAMVIRGKKRLFSFYLAFLASFVIIALFHIIRFIFGANVLSFSFFSDAMATTLGRWNDLGIYAGLALFLSLITLESVPVPRWLRIGLVASVIGSLALLVGVNSYALWVIVALFSLVFGVYSYSFFEKEGSAGTRSGEAVRALPVFTFAVFVLSLLAVFAYNPLSNFVVQRLPITHIEAAPGWQMTGQMIVSAFHDHPVFGYGPNRFTEFWALWKPADTNSTIAWNLDFSAAAGLIPTFFITGGILALLAWLAFLALFVYQGFKLTLSSARDNFSRYLIVSSFFGSLFLWVCAVVLVPSPVSFALTFLWTGVFFGALVTDGSLAERKVSFTGSPRTLFLSTLSLIVLLVAILTLGVSYSKRTIAAADFGRGAYLLNNGPTGDATSTAATFDKAGALLGDSVQMAPISAYYRGLTEYALLKLGNLANDKTRSTDAVSADARQTLGTAFDAVAAARSADPDDYLNWMENGRAYESILPYNLIPNAYDNAKAFYQQALKLYPHNLGILFALARLERAAGHADLAKQDIAQALNERPGYTDAIFLYAQILLDAKDVPSAITSLEAAKLTAPNDSGIAYQLGYLYFISGNYSSAASTLATAVQLNPSLQNAAFYLGLSYDKLGQKDQALAVFEQLAKANPGNTDLASIIANLQAGKPAVAANASSAQSASSTPATKASAAKPAAKSKKPPLKEAAPAPDSTITGQSL